VTPRALPRARHKNRSQPLLRNSPLIPAPRLLVLVKLADGGDPGAAGPSPPDPKGSGQRSVAQATHNSKDLEKDRYIYVFLFKEHKTY
jgi:hypothetical protein